MANLTDRIAWAALEKHYSEIQSKHLRDLFTEDSGRASEFTRRGARHLSRLLEEPDHAGDDRSCSWIWPTSADCAIASTPCSAATRSTSPKTGRCCTSRCARRATQSILVDGKNVVPEVHEVLDRMADFRRPRAQRRVEGLHRQAHPQRHQYRHRRLRPRPGHGLRGAAPLQPARPDVPLRLERRRHRLRRAPRPRSGRDAVHRLVEDLHHARDDDQRAHRARRGRSRSSATSAPWRSTSSPSRPTPRRSRSSASIPPTCSASGTGSAAATRWIRPSASRPCSPSGRSNFGDMLAGFHAMDEHFRTAPFERNLPVLMGLLARLVQQLLRRADGGRAALRSVPEALPRLPAAAHDGEQRQAASRSTARRSTTRPGRSSGASRAPTGSTRSTS